jgi:predicted dienelactone hydrolase
MTNSPSDAEASLPAAQGMGRFAGSRWRQQGILAAVAVAETLAKVWGPDVPDPEARRRGGVGFVREEVIDQDRGRTITTLVFHPAETEADEPEEGARPRPTAPRPLLVFAHGGRGAPLLYAHLLSVLVRRGYVVAAPVFAESTGRRASGADGDQVLTQVADVHVVTRHVLALATRPGHAVSDRVAGRRIGILGHSLGATTALAAAGRANGTHEVAAVSAVAPRLFDLGAGEAYHLGASPLLLVHGHRDRVVPLAASAATYLEAGGPRYLVGVPAGHHFEFLRRTHPTSGPLASVVGDFFDAYLTEVPGALGSLERRLDASHLQVRSDVTDPFARPPRPTLALEA